LAALHRPEKKQHMEYIILHEIPPLEKNAGFYNGSISHIFVEKNGNIAGFMVKYRQKSEGGQVPCFRKK
jgi:hypothetical protein